ncbi:hypothetical protein IAG44_04825 [Streptomyces roseirectus]|uniref:Uncharacterized protein n=1 Tax=Streptomyces roseirectus TaxID=2768066 RepID=A0A7H0I7S7_9ACTN|nr:hypothetical protein [Streptomyces roseirectus]QNP68843.1 hypothetical protein IAG44_04825 [Streptomyces roseirectus]
MLLHELATARADFTKETLEGARARTAELTTFSRLLPTAGSTQALLESFALEALAGPGHRPAAFCLAESIPQPQRLDLHLTHPDALVPFLALLPSRDRDRVVHGVSGLLARPAGRGAVHVSFDHREAEALLSVWCRGTDLGAVLREHEASVVASGRRPLWTHSTPRRAPRGGSRPFRRSTKKPVPITAAVRLRTSRYLASALLRRPGLWERLTGHQNLSVTTHEADHGLDWHVHRTVASGHPLHDDRLAAALMDALAGPDLIMDKRAHSCLPTTCHMRFVPRSNDEGWDGILTVTTTHARTEVSPAPVRRGRPFAVLGESQTPDGPTAPVPPTARGRVLQLECPPMSWHPCTPWRLAQQLGAAWALRGDHVLVIHDVFTPYTSWKRDHLSDWPRTRLPEAPAAQAPWQRMRMVPGSGTLHVHSASHDLDSLQTLVAHARERFDWVLLADSIDHRTCPDFLDGIADDYLLVTEDPGYRTSLSVSRPRHDASGDSGVPLTPTEAALLWREQSLRYVPLDRIPVTGLLLVTDAARHDTFTTEADDALARLAPPVYGRFARDFISRDRTVLDQDPERSDPAFTAEATAVATRLTSHPCPAATPRQ